jgi:hypothetical protein
MVEPATVQCQECGVELAADSPDLRLELTCDDEPGRRRLAAATRLWMSGLPPPAPRMRFTEMFYAQTQDSTRSSRGRCCGRW